ncbi:MAG TPA: Txe/YoeB family addiction module toxin [Pricia sp.]|uniref:Putative mRNA interferase YoeB n=1 Tax=Pricia antarctica TaxID=641691 RepID=A0A831VP40_9FLAO|nr:Txe/YoeB family addiction module toxin [Pricia sp.]HEA21601.1 Txe/YoeB family addiction module toxin [Pricia antarctica]
MEVVFTKRALKERQFWKKSGNRTVQKRISGLLNAILDNPYTGIGKPEALRENLSGYWSRRITQEHRMVYKIDEKKDMLVIVSIRFHY